jgi:hypothetical protein
MITDRGRLIGLWEYDAGARRIVWEAYVRPDARLKQAVAATESFVREELGGTGGNGLDSPGLASRVTALRDAGTAAAAP